MIVSIAGMAGTVGVVVAAEVDRQGRTAVVCLEEW